MKLNELERQTKLAMQNSSVVVGETCETILTQELVGRKAFTILLILKGQMDNTKLNGKLD